MHEAPDEAIINANSQCLCQIDQTAQHSTADAENISHCWALRREDQMAWSSAAVTKKSRQVLPVSPASSAPPIASCVTRSQGNASAE